MISPRVLHILSPADEHTSPDARLIPADCGHNCTANQQTHDLLDNDELENVVYCVTCYLAQAHG